MNRAWIVKDKGSFLLFYGEKPYYDDIYDQWFGTYAKIELDKLPLVDELLELKENDEPVEVILAPVDKVKIEVNKEFFTQLAEKMRLLWPSGDKDGKYAWRESVPALAKRLETLWSLRNLSRFDIDDCLKACRSYLSEFEEEKSVKYMQVIKYFVLKQKEVVGQGGRIRYISTSRFADILEGIKSVNDNQEFEELMTGSKIDNLI